MEKLYTLEEAKKIIKEENRQKAIRKAKQKARKRAERNYFLKQKLSGLVMAAIGVVTAIISHDITFSVFVLPLGLYLLFTKEKIMMF